MLSRGDHQKLERTQKLVTLGASSRQELEEDHGGSRRPRDGVAAARQRLLAAGLGQTTRTPHGRVAT